jgi:hypothetical protein
MGHREGLIPGGRSLLISQDGKPSEGGGRENEP